ncbi:MAG: 16S rRNA (cytosine(1402)-N(4))-methyltransferase RsmH, partial [Woeseia sp.]|nr:16S rRNA (cytosine(1402)-N(4))-methyltransferase RsmH [Woeseia sp.]
MTENDDDQHVPVLLDAAIDGLRVQANGIYIDGTFGRGGHSRAILERLGSQGRLLAIDRDPHAIAAAAPLKSDSRFDIERNEIAQLKDIANRHGIQGRVNGLLLDLGVSSPQLDDAQRGFSFRQDGPLDMRMDPSTGQSAAEWLATVNEKTLKQVLKEYGEERFAGRIARAVVTARDSNAITRTAELAELIAANVPHQRERKHPATRSFQAIRIAVNNELGQLDEVLDASIDVLAPAGRLCVISFHSLEDRRVKRFIRTQSRESEAYRGMPDVPAEHRPKLKTIGKAISAT